MGLSSFLNRVSDAFSQASQFFTDAKGGQQGTPPFNPVVTSDQARANYNALMPGAEQFNEVMAYRFQPQGLRPQSRPAPVQTTRPTAPTRRVQKPEAVQQTALAQSSDEFTPLKPEQVRAIMSPHVRETEREKFEQNLEEKTKRLNEAMQEFGITKPIEQAMFLATISHESRGTMANTEEPSKHPSSKLAFKGHGDIQLTFKGNFREASNYFKFGELIQIKNKKGHVVGKYYDGFVKNRELASAPEWSSRIAGWFWTKQSVASKQIGDQPDVDLLDFRHASSAVNSGRPDGKVNGWADRVAAYRRALDAFGIEVNTELAKAIEEQQRIANLSAEGKAHQVHSSQSK